MSEERLPQTPAEQVARLYEQAETEAAKAGERLVGSRGFASLLGQMAENAAAMTKLANDGLDLVLRNLRVAGRRDVVRLARQLGRSEDKLERVLQELEEVHDELRRLRESPAPSRSSAARRGGNSSRSSSSGSSARGGTGGRSGGSGGSGGSGSRSGSRNGAGSSRRRASSS